MFDSMLVDKTVCERRVALLKKNCLEELYIDDLNHDPLVGNIYKGKIIRLLPGMSAAFVDLGMEQAGFLHLKPEMPIKDLHEGKIVCVQIEKNAIDKKGPKVTLQLSFASRHLIYMPLSKASSISKRIVNLQVRDNLWNLFETEALGEKGFIIRTQAQYSNSIHFKKEIEFLKNLWINLQKRWESAKIGDCLYQELSLPLKLCRDKLLESGRIEVDAQEEYDTFAAYLQEWMPSAFPYLSLYSNADGLFNHHGLEAEIKTALQPYVNLPSGGTIIIEHTHALTTIDVNTSTFVGRHELKSTVMKTNLEAVQVIAHQIRLRNLSGIIIIDFIDMEDAEEQTQVRSALIKALADDHLKITIGDFSRMGLLELTRQRVDPGLAQVMHEPCQNCAGQGSVVRPAQIAMEIFHEIEKKHILFQGKQLTIIASPPVIEQLKEMNFKKGMWSDLIKSDKLKLRAEVSYLPHQFDILMEESR